MSTGAFWFIMVLLLAAGLVVLVEWLWRKIEIEDDVQKKEHDQLMKEIRRHKDDTDIYS
jgi:hypothetical protein